MFDDFQIPKIREFEDIVTFTDQKTGIYDPDKAKYIYALDKTDNPNMICPYSLCDEADCIDPGHYEVALSDDRKYLLLIQSRDLKALVPVIKVVVQKHSNDYDNRVFEIQQEMKKLQKKKKTTKKLEQELVNLKELELGAKIYDSKNGYYVIEYKKFNVYAWGYVPI